MLTPDLRPEDRRSKVKVAPESKRGVLGSGGKAPRNPTPRHASKLRRSHW